MRLRLIRHLAPALLIATSAAAASPLVAQQGSTNPQLEADMKEVLAYRITEASLAKLGKVQDNMIATLRANPGLDKKYANAQPM